MLERTAGAGQMEEQVEDVSGDCTSDGAAMVSPSRLVVIRVIREKGKKAVAVCECECGNEKVTQLAHVKSGAVKSCGCLKRETSAATGKKNKKHGHSSPATRSHTYRSWEAMKARCLNANDPSFKDYGARGITVEDAWMTFETFLADMGERPRGTTLDRIDVNAGYGKNNCRWGDCGAIHDRDLNAAINLKNLAAKLPRVPRKVTPVESDIRPIAVSLAASLKQEPSTESYGRFW